ncbi:MAG: hypothetical protein HFH80_06615 [Lachnospiraceae bacterium]|nr:hypothetical protein [Lachnospiraceae bacterium]
MEKYLQVMSDDYKRKHYAEGVFTSIRKKTAKISFGVYIFFGIVLLGSAFGFYWAMGRIEEYRLSGQEDMIGAGKFIAGFFACFALIALASIIITIIRHVRGTASWKSNCAKQSGYTISDMDEFERQTMDMECRVIRLLDATKALAVGQSDGILTRDYIYLADAHHTILKISDLSAACLVKQTVAVGDVPNRKRIEYLTVMLLSKSKSRGFAECSEESGTELIDYLKQRVPGLYTADGKAIPAEEFDKLSAG